MSMGRNSNQAFFLVIPETSSQLRDYIPVDWLAPPVIPSNSLKVLNNTTLSDFALLTSRMHYEKNANTFDT